MVYVSSANYLKMGRMKEIDNLGEILFDAYFIYHTNILYQNFFTHLLRNVGFNVYS